MCQHITCHGFAAQGSGPLRFTDDQEATGGGVGEGGGDSVDVDVTTRAEGEAAAEFVGGHGDVAGGDFGLGVAAGDVGHRPFVQGKYFQDPTEAAEGGQLLDGFMSEIKMGGGGEFAEAGAAAGGGVAFGFHQRRAGLKEPAAFA